MDAVQELKSRLDIVEVVSRYVALKRAGRYYKGLSPFKQEKTPSFVVNPEQQFAWCFATQQGGDAIKIVELIEGVSFVEALKLLADSVGYELPTTLGSSAPKDARDTLAAINEAACAAFVARLKEDEAAKQYLKNRGICPETQKTWRIGFAPEDPAWLLGVLNGFKEKDIEAAGLAVRKDMAGGQLKARFRGRIMFPLVHERGQVVGFTGRVLEKGEPKYLNTPETILFKKSELLFGLAHAREHVRKEKRALLVEGQMDVLACHEAGVCTAIATSGTAFSVSAARRLRRLADELVLCLDADAAGTDATLRAAKTALSADLSVSVLQLPKGCKDPDEAIQKNNDAFTAALAKPISIVDFIMHLFPHAKKNATEKKQAARVVLELAAAASSTVEAHSLITSAAHSLEVPPSVLKAEARHVLTEPTEKKEEQKDAPSEFLKRLAGLLIHFRLEKLPVPAGTLPKSLQLLVEAAYAENHETADYRPLEIEVMQAYELFSESRLREELDALLARATHAAEKGDRRELIQKLRAAEAAGDTELVSQLMQQLSK